MDDIGEICDIKQIDGKRTHRKILMPDGKEYILKRVSIPNGRINEFMKIRKMGIPGFQKVADIKSTGNQDEYWLLAEWISGNPFKPEFDRITGEQEPYFIKKITNKLRKLHTDYKQDCKVSLSETDVVHIVEQSFLPKKNRELLLSYMTERLPLVNSRYKTVVHGDMHIGNILITEDEDVVFIDLDDVRFGDPFIDLVYASNIIFSKTEYHTYYLFLKYYFGGIPPQDFWPVVNFYSICKAIMIMKAEIRDSFDENPVFSMDSFIRQHDGFQQEEPLWYREIRNKDHTS